MNEEWEDGYEAGECGLSEFDNPHPFGTDEYKWWEDGRQSGMTVHESRIDSTVTIDFGIEAVICVILTMFAVALVLGVCYA